MHVSHNRKIGEKILKHILILTLAAASLINPAQAKDEQAPKTVLAIFAHPDDEVFVAPALARAAREGEEITVVYATSGDQGPGVSNMERGAALAELREGEARCSTQALGASETIFLRHGDGTLGTLAHHPESSARKLTQDLQAILSEGDYDIVVTWGPDGGYGHADHRMVSAVATQLVQAMDSGRPSLLYPGIPKGTLPPIPEMQAWGESDPAILTINYAYEPEDLEAATRAVACHESQFDDFSRAGMMALFDQSIWQGAVHFRYGVPTQESAVGED
jgi:LmbE family N-acetylglucosaminyl deacetylase